MVAAMKAMRSLSSLALLAACRSERERDGDDADVVIVGSGASGSLLAAKLAQAGKRVVILEAGPELVLGDLYSSQVWSRRLKWGGAVSASIGGDPISVNFNQGWGTGGAALHHYAVWLRLHPEDFAMQARFGRGLDWPISYDDLRPFYDRIQSEVGISGDAGAEVWRPPGDPYPMPALPIFQQARIVERGFTKLGIRTSPLPLAINSVEFKGRPPCIFDGWCDAGCPIGALANPLVVYLPEARAAGAEIRHDSFVTRVLTDERGRRATGVEYFDATGRRHVQAADLVILTAFAVQNPRILLNSATRAHPSGLANSSGLVGKYTMAHLSTNVFGLFPEETQSYFGVTGGQLLSQERYAKDPAKGYLGSSQYVVANALKPTDLLGIAGARPEIFGEDLHAFLRTASQHIATMTIFSENLPALENELVLSDDTDAYGARLARVVHTFGADDRACFDGAVAQGHEIFRAAGAHDVWDAGRHNAHILGGTIMGRTADSSVTDSYGRTHDVENLFVAGPGLFPTSGAVNPTFTIYALTLRTADHLLSEWPGPRQV
jgi:choline dehydrogenase-like flavoprotein